MISWVFCGLPKCIDRYIHTLLSSGPRHEVHCGILGKMSKSSDTVVNAAINPNTDRELEIHLDRVRK